MKLFAKDFSNRADLEALTSVADSKKDTVVGTKLELERLHLSDQTTVHGLKCVVTDFPTEIIPMKEKIDRGKKFNHKIQ